jgi:hypothetical protein
MTNEEITRSLDSLVFKLKLSTGTEDQEILKSFKYVLLDAYKLGYNKAEEDIIKRVTENLFKIEYKNKFK